MTKYVAQKAQHKSCYHTDPDCRQLNQKPKEATENELNWHNLKPCARCCND